jgi:hypothetical protein
MGLIGHFHGHDRAELSPSKTCPGTCCRISLIILFPVVAVRATLLRQRTTSSSTPKRCNHSAIT